MGLESMFLGLASVLACRGGLCRKDNGSTCLFSGIFDVLAQRGSLGKLIEDVLRRRLVTICHTFIIIPEQCDERSSNKVAVLAYIPKRADRCH
jgi:hypothetical protein